MTRIVFMGTPDFAVPALRALAGSFSVVAVVTQPDRPSGRGKKTTPTPVKQAAAELRLPVFQPLKIRDTAFSQWLTRLSPEFLVTAAYGRILPSAVLAVPNVAALNIHASLLPRYRGAAPIHRAVINGDTESGITIMYMDEGMDTGDIIIQEAVPINFNETAGDLHDRLSILGGRMILQAVNAILAGTAERHQQDDLQATLAHPLCREEEKIDWCSPASVIHNLVRGMNPWPGAYTLYKGERLKIRSGRPEEGCASPCGQVLHAGEGTILVSTGEGAYCITEVQPSGKRVMSVREYLRGHSIPAGTLLGGEADGNP